MRTFFTTADVARANEAAGRFFFSPGAKRFFDSRIGALVYGGRYFVTSERFDADSPRLYTVRAVSEDGATIDTIGDFQAYRSSESAVRAIRRIMAGEE